MAPGTKRRSYLEQNAEAVEIELSREELSRLAELPAAAGARYDEAGIGHPSPPFSGAVTGR